MKHIVLTFSVFLILTSLFWSCESEQEIIDKNSQTAFVWVNHYNTGRRAPNWEKVNIPSVYVSAEISGNPMPEINYVQIANKQISNPLCFEIQGGGIYFSSIDQIWIDSIPEPKFSPLTIKINTGIGEIAGSVSVPDTIKTLNINYLDTVPLNTMFTMSWTGSNADFFIIEYYHDWSEFEGYWLGYSKDTIVKGNSITFNSMLTYYNGCISDISIYPVNGPFPEKGAKANMTGDGYGFLFLENKVKTSNRTVVFGKGIDYSMFEFIPKKYSPSKNFKKSVYDKISTYLQ